MIGDRLEYKYISEAVPKEKINYSYSQYFGKPFIDSWQESRQQCLLIEGSESISDTNAPTSILLKSWTDELHNKNEFDSSGLNLLVKRFEVTKRIYNEYDTNFRPIGSKDYLVVSNYLRFAETLIAAYKVSGKKPYLNALLKVNDICCSLKINREDEQSLRSENIKKERRLVSELMHDLGIK